MIVRLLSDIHLEFGNYTVTTMPDDKDSVLVLAGDIAVGTGAKDFVEKCCEQFREVILVIGNHEFYQNEYFDILAQWEAITDQIENLHFLNDDTIVIDDVRFLGTTLWSDMDNADWHVMTAARQVNDYQVSNIRFNRDSRRLRPADTVEFHRHAMEFLDKELTQEFDGKTVVVSHFAPSHSLITDEFRRSSVNYYFHANCDRLFTDYDIDYWFYGHTHRATDTKLAHTRVYSNQRGYVGHEIADQTGFNPDFIINM